jgi:hypothetical protein
MITGPWAGTTRGFGRAYRASTTQNSACRLVLGLKARHEARFGLAWMHNVPCQPETLRAMPGPCPCRAGLMAIYTSTYITIGITMDAKSSGVAKKMVP